MREDFPEDDDTADRQPPSSPDFGAQNPVPTQSNPAGQESSMEVTQVSAQKLSPSTVPHTPWRQFWSIEQEPAMGTVASGNRHPPSVHA